MAGLDEELQKWLAGGLAGAVATVGDRSQTTVVRVFGQRASGDGAHVDFCIARSDAQPTLRNLERHPLAALNLVCPRTYRSLLFKGPCTPPAPHLPDALLQRCMQLSNEALAAIGMPTDAVEQILSHYGDRSMVTLRLRVNEVFDQSPGPHAGERL